MPSSSTTRHAATDTAGGDPILRFAQSEAIEACGNVFFEAVAPVAVALTRSTGVEYRYLGPYHLARESGHMDIEGVFERVVLDERRRTRALDLANATFDGHLQGRRAERG